MDERFPDLYDLYYFICTCDMSNDENYKYFADRVDMKNFAQWMLLQGYFNNLDPTGNIRYCQGNYPDNKWRLMFFDLDISMANDYAGWENVMDASAQIGRMTRNLLKSELFRQELLETASELYKNGLNHQLVLDTFNTMIEQVADEMPRNLKRWRESIQMYESNLEWQREKFSEFRDQTWLELIQYYTGADDATMAEYFPAQ